MTIGKRIQAARKRLRPKLTQRALADKLRITYQAVSQWERGIGAPKRAKLPDLARILQVPVAWLHEGSGPPPAPDVPDAPDDLLKLIGMLPAEDLVVMTATAKALLARRTKAA